MIYHSNAMVVLVILSTQCNISGTRRKLGIINTFTVHGMILTFWVVGLKGKIYVRQINADSYNRHHYWYEDVPLLT